MLMKGVLGQYPLGTIGTVVPSNLREATRQTVYAPRPLIVVTLPSGTGRYSTETLETP